MAGGEADFKTNLQELRNILWGGFANPDTFKRWAQGFVFSETETTALEQQAGGPCAILAPIQAFMLKIILASNEPDSFKPIVDRLKFPNFQISKEVQRSLLVRAMVEILLLSNKNKKSQKVTLVYRQLGNGDKTEAGGMSTQAWDVGGNTASTSQALTAAENAIASTSTYPAPTLTKLDSGASECPKPVTHPDTKPSLKSPPASSKSSEPATSEKLNIVNDAAKPSTPASSSKLIQATQFTESAPIIGDHVKSVQCTAESFSGDDLSTDKSFITTVKNSQGMFYKYSDKSCSSMNNLFEADDSEHEILINTGQMSATSETEIRDRRDLTFNTIEESILESSPSLECGEHYNAGCDERIVQVTPMVTLAKRDCSTQSDYEYSSNFHESLCVVQFTKEEDVERFLLEHVDELQGEFGILLFLYSLLLTKGVEQVKCELGDLSEPLIHEIYGYGSQALVNLMLTGRAVQHVWDNDQDVGGLTLSGIDQQSDIGFITLMEHMRYCTVGSFFKSPRCPIWILGSETHLTVLFSFEKRLVSPEQPWETAKRIFRSFDPDGNNFITSIMLQDILQTLGFVSDPEYVQVMRRKLDAENLGIILLSTFLEEFYPNAVSMLPDAFTLWHYNGLAGAHNKNNVHYVQGHAVLLECDIKSGSDSNQMLTCLQTKWPTIEVNWCTPNNKPPSLN